MLGRISAISFRNVLQADPGSAAGHYDEIISDVMLNPINALEPRVSCRTRQESLDLINHPGLVSDVIWSGITCDDLKI